MTGTMPWSSLDQQMMAERNVTPALAAVLAPRVVGDGVVVTFPTLSGRPFHYTAMSAAAVAAGAPKYISPEGRGEIPRPVPRPDASRVLIVEGCWDIVAAAGYAPPDTEVWGVFGCRNWSREGVPFGELAAVSDRDVVVAFDGDAADSRDIFDAGERLAGVLTGFGARSVKFIRGLSGKAGIDDVVRRQLQDGLDPAKYLAALMQGAKPKPYDRRPDARRKAEDAPRNAGGDFFTDASLADVIGGEWLSRAWLYTKGMGWLSWDGRVWVARPEEAVIEMIRKYVRYRFAHAVAGDSEDRDALVKGWQSAESAVRIRAIAALCRGVLLADAAMFDQDPDILVCGNGVVHLPTGVLMAHDPARLVTKCTTVPYVPGAVHPDWTQALAALPDDAVDWYQAFMGQATTGHAPPEEHILIQQGGGNNGKGVLTNAVAAALGDYYVTVPDEVLIGDSDSHKTVWMRLRGARFALLNELPEGAVLNTVRLKKVTDETISARYLYKDETTFATTHTLVVNTNPMPRVTGTDHATWRRLVMMPFPWTFVSGPDEIRKHTDRVGVARLRSTLIQGGDGRHEAVLAWLVTGARRWYEGRTPALPASVTSALRVWRSSDDVVGDFTSEMIEFVPHSGDRFDTHVAQADLLAVFSAWALANGHAEVSKWHGRTAWNRIMQHALWAGNVTVGDRCKPNDSRSRYTPVPGVFAQTGERSVYVPIIGCRFRG